MVKKPHDFVTSASFFRGSYTYSYKREQRYHEITGNPDDLKVPRTSDAALALHDAAMDIISKERFDDWVIHVSDDEGIEDIPLEGNLTGEEAARKRLYTEIP